MGRAHKDWDTSCKDWEKRFLAGQSLVPKLPLYEAEAQRAVDIFNLLRLPDVPDQPRLGEAGDAWFLDIVRALFGSYDVVADKRRITEVFCLVPKKNGKSTYSAALMLTAVLVNERPNAEFMFIAPSIEVAAISFRQARNMIRAEPELMKIFHIQDNFKRITNTETDSFLQIKTADLDVVTGSKPVGILVDETHVFATHARAADVFIEIRGALAAKPDGFMVQISTQSKAPPAGQFKVELERARAVRDGDLKLPKPLLPVLYELPPKIARNGGWKEPKYWGLLNPNLGHSVDYDFLRSSLIDAERGGPGQMALFASQHFNVEIGLALRADRWPGAEFWEKQTKALTLPQLIERSEAIVIGIDGGGLDDLFGLCVLGRDKENQDWLCWSHGWCHRMVMFKRQTIAATLLDFEKRGELTIVDSSMDDLSAIVSTIGDVKESGKLRGVAVDPAGLGELVDALAEIKITPENKLVVGAPQGYGLMNAMKTCERKLENGTLWHSDSALMAWCVSNVKIEPTATAIRATKQNAGDLKIDCAIALFNAATLLWQVKKAPDYQLFFVG